MKPTWIIGITIVAILVVAVGTMAFLGYIAIPGLEFRDSADQPPGAAYCDYTDMQILDMLETVANKDLDNSIGITFVRGLNMEACGSNGVTGAEIASYYKTLYSADWYVWLDDTIGSAGWTAHRLAWANSPTNATLAKAVSIGSGVTVKQTYGYDVITITSDSPVLTYQAFFLWVATS